jgi:hypothetical protein
MDGVASGFAVVSLAIQLIQSINTVKTFIRDVKGAPKELARLLELLNRLSALLDDVRGVMERQTSLRQCPLPPQTIFDCLKSCEASLKLLEDIIETYKGRQGSASGFARLKDDIKFGFKSKDISDFEARIQGDINYLTAALSPNNTNLQ